MKSHGHKAGSKKSVPAFKYGPLGIQAVENYRRIPEARIVKALTLAGWAYEADTASAEKSAQKALESWIKLGLGFASAPRNKRLFDPAEVHNFMKRAALEGRDDFFFNIQVPTHRRMVSDMANSTARKGERKFEVDLKRTFNLRPIPKGTKLRLRASLPLTSDYLTKLSVKPFTENAEESRINVDSGRLELRMVTDGEAEATLGAKIRFTACDRKSGNPFEEIDQALYLRHREGLIVVSDRILVLSKSLAPPGMPEIEAVRAFWNYINTTLTGGTLHYDQIDVASPCDWVLDAGWFDCQMASALFAALCRARGIPARIVGGCTLYLKAPTNHYWVEAWIKDQGWAPFDFASWDLSGAGRDPEWSDHFFGRLDCRMTYERLPREFLGAPGVPIPQTWRILQYFQPGGVGIDFVDAKGTPVYSDTVRVKD